MESRDYHVNVLQFIEELNCRVDEVNGSASNHVTSAFPGIKYLLMLILARLQTINHSYGYLKVKEEVTQLKNLNICLLLHV
jgi:hypothetical protein